MPDGSKFVYEKAKKNAEPTSVDMLSKNEDQGTTISSATTNSIPQNSEKSTENGEKNQQENVSEAEYVGKRPTEMTEDERKRGYTDKEADVAHGEVLCGQGQVSSPSDREDDTRLHPRYGGAGGI